MSKPRLLDGFCGAGGATKGYQRAGFHVVGVDVRPQPHYCGDEFIQADFFDVALEGYDAIHVSPVCKRWSQVTRTAGIDPDTHPDQIADARRRLQESGLPYVIENVPQAPLIDPTLLCGSMFDLDVRRHRHFETNWDLRNHPWPCRHRIWSPRYVPNRSDRKRVPFAMASVVSVAGGGSGGYGGHVADWREAMGIDWMTRNELTQAIPPAYTEFIGEQLLAALAVTP